MLRRQAPAGTPGPLHRWDALECVARPQLHQALFLQHIDGANFAHRDPGYRLAAISGWQLVKEPLNKTARARRSLCGITRRGFDERGLVIPNKRVETHRVARKGPSRRGFAGEAASRAT